MISPTSEQYDLLQKRLRERLEESHGETIYDIGIAQGNKPKREALPKETILFL